MSAILSINIRQTDIRQHDSLTGIHGFAQVARNNDDFLKGILKAMIEILVQSPEAGLADAFPGSMRSIGTESDINPGLSRLFLGAGLVNAALRIAAHAHHDGHDFVQGDFFRAFLAFEVELGSLIIAQMTPIMLSFPILINRRQRLFRKERDPVFTVEASLDDQIPAADIGHFPLVMTSNFGHVGLNLLFCFGKYIYQRSPQISTKNEKKLGSGI
jgi:hypothetical protein